MCPSPAQNHPPDRGRANQARLPAAQVHSVLQLKEAPYPIRIHIIRHR
jgi:hypothetical protein